MSNRAAISPYEIGESKALTDALRRGQRKILFVEREIDPGVALVGTKNQVLSEQKQELAERLHRRRYPVALDTRYRRLSG